MTQSGKNVLRDALCAAAIYLAGDFFIFHGQANRWVRSALTPDTKNLTARVSGHPITRSQLDRALDEQLWSDGKSAAALTPAELKLARDAARQDLIDHELLRLEAGKITSQLPVSAAEIDERIRRLVGRFENKGALETAMKSQGVASEADLRARLTARIRQEKLIELRIAPSIKVTDNEAKKWFDENQAAVSLPERIEVRHIFIPTLDHPPEEAKQKLDAALADLTANKKDFAALAKEVSEDPATKDSGGSLSWMTRDRLPADFAAPVFLLETSKPTLIRTKLGWHLVEVTARKPAEPRSYEQAKPEILAALEAVKRRQATTDFRLSLRKQPDLKIEIFGEVPVR